MIWNTIQLALQAIRRNLLRSFLTILGIVIGVAAVITMVTLGNGATQAISNQIASLGSNLLLVMPKQERRPGASSTAKPFEIRDVEAIQSQISSLKAVAPVVESSATAIYGANNWSTSVTGSTNDYFVASNWKFASGRSFSEAEL
ncbi:MAG: ABC transporter permease, partial [Acidobacteriota bacterium]